MENNRAGFSFKVVGVVGFVLLAFLLFRILRLPDGLDGLLASEMLPSFLMLLLGVLILAASFILLALGRIVELLHGFKVTEALLQEIRDETERVRIESQYIYELQKDTLVNMSSPNLPATAYEDRHEELMTQQQNDFLVHGETQENNQDIKANDIKAKDIKANTDESTWSTLVTSGEDLNKNSESNILRFDKENNLPLADADYDRAALDGSDDVVDDAPQPKNWQPVSAEELISRESEGSAESFESKEARTDKQKIATKNIANEFDEVKDVGESLDSLKPVGKPVDSKPVAKSESTVDSKSEVAQVEPNKPVFDDRLSQTENIDNAPQDKRTLEDESVRFGSFPEKKTNKLEYSRDKANRKSSSFTLEDITDQDFSNDTVAKPGFVSKYNRDKKQESLEEVFSDVRNEVKDDVKDLEKNTQSREAGFDSNSSFDTQDFDTVEDSFDDIREVFDTKTTKMSTNVKDSVETASVQDGIKDTLNQVTKDIRDKQSDLGKNLN